MFARLPLLVIGAIAATSGVSASASETAHHDKVATAVAAVKLMESGVGKYLGEGVKVRSEAASEKLLKDMLGNFKLLGKVLGEWFLLRSIILFLKRLLRTFIIIIIQVLLQVQPLYYSNSKL